MEKKLLGNTRHMRHQGLDHIQRHVLGLICDNFAPALFIVLAHNESFLDTAPPSSSCFQSQQDLILRHIYTCYEASAEGTPIQVATLELNCLNVDNAKPLWPQRETAKRADWENCESGRRWGTFLVSSCQTLEGLLPLPVLAIKSSTRLKVNGQVLSTGVKGLWGWGLPRGMQIKVEAIKPCSQRSFCSFRHFMAFVAKVFVFCPLGYAIQLLVSAFMTFLFVSSGFYWFVYSVSFYQFSFVFRAQNQKWPNGRLMNLTIYLKPKFVSKFFMKAWRFLWESRE